MFKSFLLVLALFSTPAYADYYLLEPTKASMEGYRILNHRNPYWDHVPNELGEPWTSGGAFNLNFNFLRYRDALRLFAENRLHFESTSSQMRSAGWAFRLGVDFSNSIRLFWHHHSEHLLDTKLENETRRKYPLWDSYNIEFVFLEK